MSNITIQNTDPGEGSPLAADNYIAVYGGVSLLDLFYPVGCFFETTDTQFDPNITWGGVWVEDTAGQVLVAIKDDWAEMSSVGQTGGEKEHQLRETELPYIEGSFTMHSAASATNIHARSGHFTTTQYNINMYRDGGNVGSGAPSYGNLTFSFGGNISHNNLQPFMTIKRWHRTA